MSVASKYGVVVPAALEFIGAAVMFGTAIGQSGVARYFAFAGGLMFAAGYLWSYLVNKANAKA